MEGPQTRTSSLPSWAQTLLARPAIEVRKGLSWMYNTPSEKSSVLVLTAPSGKYVDIRFALSSDSYSTSFQNQGQKFHGFATAGLSEASIQEGSLNGDGATEGYPCLVHVTWHHPIDSSRSFESDEADIFLLENGDTMEVGVMTNQKTGKVELFKEYWTTPTPKPRTTTPCVVAEIKDGQNGTKGMIVRIGDYVQGIVQTEEEGGFWVERWQRDVDRGEEWIKYEKSNTEDEGTIPITWVVNEERRPGDRLQAPKGTWEIAEVFKG